MFLKKVASPLEDDEDLTEAMGTLMAYGGKYLREVATWAWEYTTESKAEGEVDTFDFWQRRCLTGAPFYLH